MASGIRAKYRFWLESGPSQFFSEKSATYCTDQRDESLYFNDGGIFSSKSVSFLELVLTMRLTLRTLLAYLDGVLDPSDAELLGGKIRDSQLASTLKERIDACLKRRHLGAPTIDGRGLGGDPNSVAEYLDNTLSQDRISEFERICLESDVQLAEVAACHQILSIVLGQPAIISSSLRKRVQALENADQKSLASAGVDVRRRGDHYSRIDRSHSQTQQPIEASVTSETAEHLVGGVRASKQPDTIRREGIDLANRELTDRVPEYLRGRSSNGWKQVALTMVLLVLLGFLSWQAIGSWESLQGLLMSDTAQRSQGNPKRSESNSRGEANGKSSTVENSTEKMGLEDVGRGKEGPSAGPSDKKADKGSDPETELPASTEVAIKQDSTSKVEQGNGDPSAIGEVARSEGSPNPTGEIRSLPSSVAARWLPETREAKESLLFWMPKGEEMLPRLAGNGEAIPSGSRILVPPVYRTELRLEPGIRWSVAGTTDMEVVRHGDRPGILVRRGRGIAFASIDCQQLQVDLDDRRSVVIQMTSPTSIAAIEVRHFFGSGGMLLENAHAPRVLNVMAIEGNLACSILVQGKQEGAPVPVAFGSALGWVEGAPPTTYTLTSTPSWLRTNVQRPIELRAAEDLFGRLGTTKPSEMIATLKELATHRRPETAALAARTLFLLGDYSSLLEEGNILMNPSLRAHWDTILEDLRMSVSTEESRWKTVQELWKGNFPDRAEGLTKLLSGFSQEQLAAGGDQRIVESLGALSLDLRVLASFQIKQVMGNDFDFLPDRPSQEAIQTIRKIQASGKLRYPQAPSALPEAVPALPAPSF